MNGLPLSLMVINIFILYNWYFYHLRWLLRITGRVGRTWIISNPNEKIPRKDLNMSFCGLWGSLEAKWGTRLWTPYNNPLLVPRVLERQFTAGPDKSQHAPSAAPPPPLLLPPPRTLACPGHEFVTSLRPPTPGCLDHHWRWALL